MGTTNTKKEIKIIRNNDLIMNYPKRIYYHAKKENHAHVGELNSEKPFSLDLKPLNPSVKEVAKKKKQESPKKKAFKNEENLETLGKLTDAVILHHSKNPVQHSSPKLKIARNSISYEGEFAIKLQEVAESAMKEEKSKKVKDMSCFDAIKVIGRGTFGKVVLVKNKMDDQLLALKCIKKHQIVKNKNIENIKNEKRILEKIDHPFIIKLRFTFQNRDKLFLAFDYYNGGELFFHLQKHKRFSENLSRFYAAEIFTALTYLHKQKYIYRDLKPENVILEKTGHIKLIDFGLAKGDISNTNLTGTICGTNEYIPPEVICGKKYGFNFDWWGFGNILYEMLFGYPAFNDQNKSTLFKKIVYSEPTYKGANLSAEALDLLKKLLKKDPKERIKPNEIPNHPWFKDINFEDIKNMRVIPPFKPKLRGDEDLSNIDPSFLNEAINSPVKSFNPQMVDQNYFSDF
jgi:serine/threonine protein kinase